PRRSRISNVSRGRGSKMPPRLRLAPAWRRAGAKRGVKRGVAPAHFFRLHGYRGMTMTKARVLYDGDCAFCCKSIGLLQKLDWLGKLDYVNVRDETQPILTEPP